MSPPSSANLPKQHSVGVTFSAAMWALGVFAFTQVAAVGWRFLADWDRPELDAYSEPGLPTAAPPAESGATGASALAPYESGMGSSVEPAPTDGGAPPPILEAGTPPVDGTGGTTGDAPPPAHSAIGLVNRQAGELLELGMAMRERGDTQGALEKFRQAQASLPDHPLLVSEIAQTYERMGLAEKAAGEWRKIYEMGATKAGDHYTVAAFKLSGGLAGGASEEQPADAAGTGRLAPVVQVDEIRVADRRKGVSGERVLLQIALRARHGAQLDNAQLVVHVFFYDLVDGVRVDRTTADSPVFNWTTPPVDWRGIELLEVEYAHPANYNRKELGDRQYYGYVVKVYYRDRVQDVRAEPSTLVDFMSGMGEPGLLPRGVDKPNPLFPGR